MANPASEDWSDGDWDTYRVEMERIVDDLTKNLFKAFKEFILQVEFPENIDGKKLNLYKNALYLNFNYTNSLEYYYDIPGKNILYIHKSANVADSVLILGHGVDPENFKTEDAKPPEGLNEEELLEWRDQMSDNFDLSYDMGKTELMSYFSKSFKHTEKVIKENAEFFGSIKSVIDVKVLGHSLSQVDKAYLVKVFNSIQKNAIWTVSYHREDELNSHRQKLKDIGVTMDKMRFIRMEELKENS